MKFKSILIAAILAVSFIPIIVFDTGCSAIGASQAGVTNPHSIAFLAMRDTWTNVQTGMEIFNDRIVAGKVTAEKEQQINAIYNDYRAAYRQAVQINAADWTDDSAANVENLSNQVIQLLAGIGIAIAR